MEYFSVQSPGIETRFQLTYTCKQNKSKTFIYKYANGNPSDLFIEEGALVEGAILNTNDGPIYIGQNAEVMEEVLLGGLAFAHMQVFNLEPKCMELQRLDLTVKLVEK